MIKNKISFSTKTEDNEEMIEEQSDAHKYTKCDCGQ